MSGFRKMLHVSPPTIIHQVDQYNEIWLLAGVGKRHGQPLEKLGWKWVRGRPGAWEAPNREAAMEFIKRGVPVVDTPKGE